MGILAVDLFITLDGVYQAPGGPEEDPEHGFAFGGWQAPYIDDESGEVIGAGIDRLDALMLGRKTYDIFADYWPRHADTQVGAKFAEVQQRQREWEQPEARFARDDSQQATSTSRWRFRARLADAASWLPSRRPTAAVPAARFLAPGHRRVFRSRQCTLT